MKTNMKKLAAWMLALLLMLQIMPVMAAGTQYTSDILKNDSEYRDKLEISGPKTIAVDETATVIVLTEGYNNLEWSSNKPDVATVEDGVITGVSAGNAKITAKEGTESDSIIIKIIEASSTENEDSELSKTGEKMIIIISGNKDKLTYDGQEHEYSGYSVDCSDSRFDESKLALINEEKAITAKDCGTYMIKYEASDFEYDDPDVNVIFDLNDGWMQIKPKEITIKADDVTIMEGEEDPELTATVTGTCGEDTVSYFLIRQQGTNAGTYSIDVHGEEKQGNYKIKFEPGVMTIVEKEAEPLTVSIVCLHPAGEPVEYGMGITLEATVTGAEEGEYTIQWQYSTDFQNWVDIPGANSLSYTFTANGETVTYSWRAVADRIQ